MHAAVVLRCGAAARHCHCAGPGSQAEQRVSKRMEGAGQGRRSTACSEDGVARGSRLVFSFPRIPKEYGTGWDGMEWAQGTGWLGGLLPKRPRRRAISLGLAGGRTGRRACLRFGRHAGLPAATASRLRGLLPQLLVRQPPLPRQGLQKKQRPHSTRFGGAAGARQWTDTACQQLGASAAVRQSCMPGPGGKADGLSTENIAGAGSLKVWPHSLAAVLLVVDRVELADIAREAAPVGVLGA